ncbi:MAG TPA: nuclear transport factor 2 family protein [Stellaceae bacterium]|jgi:ketosteroid isomerase-like protein|nr:nuclear transport factor 2 family protein [Stellaceae bacterium]
MPTNLELTRKGYEFFLKGDIEALLRDIIDEDCQWVIPGPRDKITWAGAFSGKVQIGNFFKLLAQNVEFTKFEPRQMIDGGDTIVVIGSAAGRMKSTGKDFKNEWVQVARYRSGRMIAFQDYSDTAQLAAALT